MNGSDVLRKHTGHAGLPLEGLKIKLDLQCLRDNLNACMERPNEFEADKTGISDGSENAVQSALMQQAA